MAPSETFLRLKALGRRQNVTNEARVSCRDAVQGEDGSLPSCAALESEFGLFGRGGRDDDDGRSCAPRVDDQGRVSCACDGCARWKAYVAGALPPPWPSWPQYEVLTREHVVALAAYLRSRAARYGRAPLRVLEVGAGDGRLAYHLRKAIRSLDVEDEDDEDDEEDEEDGGTGMEPKARRRAACDTAVVASDGGGPMDERTAAATAGKTRAKATRAACAPSVEIVATDSNVRGLADPRATPYASSVVAVDALDAIAAAGGCTAAAAAASTSTSAEVPPCDVVIACWQPMGVGLLQPMTLLCTRA